MMKTLIKALLILLATSGAAMAQEPTPATRSQLTLDDLRTFTDVFNQLRTNFVEEVDDRTLLNAAIEGMITRLDPYSAFVGEEFSREMDDSARGRYGGIGVRVDMRNGRIVVDEVIAGGPAEKAGVQPGDLVTAVDGKTVRERRLFESVDALMGEPGTAVDIRVKTPGQTSRDLRLQREFIPVSSVRGLLLEDRYGYFEISHFHRNSHADLQQQIEQVKATTGNPLEGIIIDLRGNPGGVLRPAVEMADGFLDEGLIVYTRGRYEATRLEFNARPGQWMPGIPLVILVDGRTASASEVLAAALRDHDRAILIGEKTFGKGSIQSVFNLRNGSTLKLTTAHYFTPSGATIHENGIEPDIVKPSVHEGLIFGMEPKDDPLVIEALEQLRNSPAMP